MAGFVYERAGFAWLTLLWAPMLLIVSLIGWKAAGVAGAVVAMASMCAPSSVLTYYVAKAWERFRDAPLRIAIQRAIAGWSAQHPEEPIRVRTGLHTGEVIMGNVGSLETLFTALDGQAAADQSTPRPLIVLSSSAQASIDTPYGRLRFAGSGFKLAHGGGVCGDRRPHLARHQDLDPAGAAPGPELGALIDDDGQVSGVVSLRRVVGAAQAADAPA